MTAADGPPDLDEIRAQLRRAEELERSDPSAARDLAVDVEERLGALPSDATVRELRAWARYRQARVAFFARQLPVAWGVVAGALAIFEELGDHAGMVVCDTLMGVILGAFGHLDAALERFDRAIGRADERGLDALVIRARLDRAAALRADGSLEGAAAEFDRALADGRGAPKTRVAGLINQASLLWQVDRVDDGRRALAEARALCAEHGIEDLDVWLDAIESWVEVAGGNFARARETGERAWLACKDGGDANARISVTRAHARALALAPEAEEPEIRRARDMLEALHAESLKTDWSSDRPLICSELADVCEALGDLEAAVRWLREARVADEQLQEVRRRRRSEGEKLRRDG